jgi:anti-sigma B factor antagonist
VTEIRSLDPGVAASSRPVPFTLDARPDRQRVILAAHGELDLATVEQLRSECDELVSRGFDTMVLDLRGLVFLDSTGLRFILEQSARPDATITVIDGRPLVSRLFDITGTRAMLTFEAGS